MIVHPVSFLSMKNEPHSKRHVLRQQAQNALEQLSHPPSPDEWRGLDGPRLLEELRIYQIELELQNEELLTAQLQAESALSHYRLLFGVLPLPTLLVDGFGVVKEDNEASQDWFGPVKKYHPNDLRLTQAIDRADRSRLSKLWLSMEPGRKGLVTSVTIRGFDQRERLVDVHLARLPHHFHPEPRFLVVLLDRSPDAARLSEQHLFQTLLDSSDDLIYATDVYGRLMLANQAFLGLAGVSRERALGRKAAGFWPVSHMAAHQHAEHQVLDQGQAVNLLEDMNWAYSTQAMRLASRIFPLRNRRGESVGVGSMSRQLPLPSPSQQEGDAPHWSLSALATLPWPLVVTTETPTGHIRWVNPAFETLSGFSARTLTQHTIVALSSHAGWQLTTQMLPWTGPFELRDAQGQCTLMQVSVTALPLDEDGHSHCLWSWSVPAR